VSWTSERARVASLSRSRNRDDPDLLAARRDLRAARAEDYIKALVDSAPPLTDAQRDRLAVLLRGAAA
jgi:F0F1-type ATP synthase delta subunit